MKTVGQIIKAARQQRGLSLDQLSNLTKIDSRYLAALEEDNYFHLPSETFIKGFIRNISQRLSLNSDELVAIFRRDFRQPGYPTHTTAKRRPPLYLGLSPQVLPIIIGGLVFIVYLVFQFRSILKPPKLEIIKPVSSSVIVSPFEIEGFTSLDATISINEDTQVKPDVNGHFLVRFSLPVGETTISIRSTNRFSRSTTRHLNLTILSK